MDQTGMEERKRTKRRNNRRIDKGQEDRGQTLNDSSGGFFQFEEVSTMFRRGRRDWSVDILRCLSCFMVCAVHATSFSISYFNSYKEYDGWLHLEFYRMLFASPTVLFVMISGIFFLSPERNVTASRVWKKNVIKMAAAYAFWSMVYAIYRIHMMDPQPKITGELVFNEWLVQPIHLWYIPMIIGLYIICPILRPITASRDKGLFKYIILIFIGGLILWTIVKLPCFDMQESYVRRIIDKTPMALICQYPMWMIIGWICYTYRPVKGLRYLIYLTGLISIACGIVVSHAIGVDNEINVGYAALTYKFSIFVFFKNISIFYFIINVFGDRDYPKWVKNILRKLSSYTLIIYLAHYLILYILHDNGFPYSLGVSPWIGVWINAAVSFLGGALVAAIFHGFMDILSGRLTVRKKRSKRIYDRIEKEARKK